MALGTAVEVRAVVDDLAGGLAFFDRLGFQRVGEAVVTDGGLNIRLAGDGQPGLRLDYAGGQPGRLAELGLDASGDDRAASFTAPDGLVVRVTAAASSTPMPAGTALTRVPLSRCGKFGEFSLPVADLATAAATWERCGFNRLFTAEEPYPWAILSDDLVVLGLHQTTHFSGPHITYFAADMADRIARFQAEGLAVTPVPPELDGRVVNAVLPGPGRLRLFLFSGEL